MEEESNEINEVGIQESHEETKDNDDNNIANLKEDLAILKEELLTARESADNNLNKLRYMMAEFDNYRKQTEKQLSSKVEARKAELLLNFLVFEMII